MPAGENAPTTPPIPANNANLSADGNLENPLGGPAGGYSEMQAGMGAEGTAVITFKAVTSNVVTLTTQQAHSFLIGDQLDIAGCFGVLDGLVIVVSTPSTTTFTYALVTGNIGSTAVTNGIAVGVDLVRGQQQPEYLPPEQPAANQAMPNTDKGVIG
jgi:hypothetical protein